MDNSIFISLNVPSSKNGRPVVNGVLINNTSYPEWLRKIKGDMLINKTKFKAMVTGLPKPYFIVFKFVRKSRHKFDYTNIAQAIQDAMTKFQWYEDDNADILLPYFEPYEHNKLKPGVYIKVLKYHPNIHVNPNQLKAAIEQAKDMVVARNADAAIKALIQALELLN